MKDNKSDPAASAVFFQTIGASFVIGWAVFIGHPDFTGVGKIIPNLLATMVLIGFFYLFVFKSLKLIDASEFIIIMSTRPLFTIFASTLILGEGLTAKQYIGVVGVLLGVIIVTWHKTRFQFGRGEMFALLAAICLGFAGTNDRIALKEVSLGPYLLISSILPGLFVAVTNHKSLPKMKYFLKRTPFLKMLLMTLIQLGAIVTLLAAFKYGHNSSQIASIAEINIILTVVLGMIFLGEHTNWKKKIIGSFVAVFGLLLLG